MRKFLAIAVIAVFILGFAATAFAIHAEIPSETQAVVAKGETQITLGGSIRVRGEMIENIFYTEDINDFTEAELGFDFNGDGDMLDTFSSDKAAWDQRVRLSMDAKVADNVQGFVMLEAGNGDTADNWTWGESGNGATGVYTFGNAHRGQVQILEAWINYNTEIASLKIGHMPLALGNLIFFDHRKFGDDAVVLYKNIDNFHLAALAIKFKEESTGVADDSNSYVALFTYRGEDFNVSGDVTWVNDNAFFGLVPSDDADLVNFGLRGDINITENFNLRADMEMQIGDTNTGLISGLPCGLADCDFGGYALMAGGSVRLDPVTLDIEVGLGSGDDNAADEDVEIFITSLSSGIPYITYVHGTRSINQAGFGNGITNLTYIKGSVIVSPVEKMTARASVVFLKATEDYMPGTDNVGWEVDGEVKYRLANGLVYWVEGGYFFVDDDYAIVGTEADDAYAVRHGIELTF